MRQAIISLISLLIIHLMFSCNSRHDHQIATALSLTDSDKADSALSLLQKIDRDQLSEADEARYCLAYTIAQDKAGITIDNDSLIRTAYDWYNKRPNDELFGKCMYYMGEYYALNDSSEKALNCLHKSVEASKKTHDNNTQCLSLEQQSKLLREYHPEKAISKAMAAVSLYNNMRNAKPNNKAYYLLNLAECISGNGDINNCILLTNKAIKYATISKDTTAISDSYQDLSTFYRLNNDLTLALKASKVSNRFNARRDFSKEFSLCQLYILTDSLKQAEQELSKSMPSNLDDSCSIFYLKRDIAIRKHNWGEVETFSDSADFYLDKKNNENLKAKNRYYSMMLQKEIAITKLSYENRWNTILICLISFVTLLIISFSSYIFYLRKKRMLEIDAEKEKAHQMEINDKIKQLTTMKSYLLNKIDIVQRLQSIDPSSHKPVVLHKEDWKELEVFLNNTNDNFVTRLKKEFSKLTQKDIQFLMLVRLNIPYKSIAIIYNIEEKSVKQRLFLFKNKLGLNKGEKSTREFIRGF